jgi:hypothetical protein
MVGEDVFFAAKHHGPMPDKPGFTLHNYLLQFWQEGVEAAMRLEAWTHYAHVPQEDIQQAGATR